MATLARMSGFSVKSSAGHWPEPSFLSLRSAVWAGRQSATAAVATIGDAKLFKNGRAVAAWLGMVPQHSGTGGKIWMGPITGKGDTYLRTLFIQGARSVLNTTRGKSDPLSLWVERLRARSGDNVAAVALAAKIPAAAHGRVEARPILVM